MKNKISQYFILTSKIKLNNAIIIESGLILLLFSEVIFFE